MFAAVAGALLRVALPDPCNADPAAAGVQRVCIVAAGDVLFGRYIPKDNERPRYSRVTRDPDPFAGIMPLVGAADIGFVNLETPVLEEPIGPFFTRNTLTFRADRADAERLAHAGFDVVALANNHMGNFGPRGAAATRNAVESAGLRGVGAGATVEEAFAPVLMERHGLRIAFLAITAWDNFDLMEDAEGAVAHVQYQKIAQRAPALLAPAIAANPDFIVVSVHWGLEYERAPVELQRTQARALIRAGADVVLGHHPHVTQGVERLGSGVVAYSLGNFMFDQTREPTRATALLGIILEREGVTKRIAHANVVPVVIDAKTHLPSIARAPRDCWVWRELAAGAMPVALPEVCRPRLAAAP